MKFSINKNLEDIILDDLYVLVNNQVPESIFLDYKRDLYGKNNGDKKELLKDVSAFANSSGGDLLIGIEEDKHNQAFKIVGFESNNIFEEINRIEQIVYAGLEPKLSNFKIKHLKLPNGKFILIIRVEPSALAPHMVSYRQTSKFYIRKSDKNLLLDVYELRNIFIKSENFVENIRKENKKRILSVFTNETIVPTIFKPKITINIIPYSFIDNKTAIDFSTANINLGFPEQRINFDGLLGYKTNSEGIESYCQFYRNGIIEYVSASSKIFGNVKNPFYNNENIDVIYGYKNGFEIFLEEKCKNFINILKKNNIQMPIYIFVSIVDAKGYRIIYKTNGKTKITNSIDRDLLELPELEIRSYKTNLSKYLVNLFNMIWNSCGEKKSVNYF